MKYLNRGHTYMRADSIYGSIGAKLKSQSEVVDFHSFSRLCENASEKNRCFHLEPSDIYSDFVKEVRGRTTKSVTLPRLDSIVEVEFRRDDRNMYYKTSFKEKEYISCDFLMKRSDVMKFPTAMTEERGISSVKKQKTRSSSCCTTSPAVILGKTQS